MSAHIITVAQQKGGAGKTTVATHLGIAYAGMGKTVAFIDVDPQQSLTAWYEARKEHVGEADNLTMGTLEGWKASSAVSKLRKMADVVIIDSPPHAETAARLAVREADLLVVPLQPSPMDIWAMRKTLELAERERSDMLLVMNRVPPRSKIADELIQGLKKEKLPLARTRLGNRTAYAAALMQGKGVSEVKAKSKAAQEMAKLAKEVWKKVQG